MFNQNKVFLLRSMTMKHTPFSVAAPDTDGKLKPEQRPPTQKKFTYKNIKGQPLTLQKKKYTWSDATKRDKDGKPEGAVIEAVLKVETLGAYNYEEYETNEFERIAVAEEWPVEQVMKMILAAPEVLEVEMKANKKLGVDLQKKQNDIDSKLNTVIENYGSLFTTYDNVRLEISAMAVELPALKGTPYDRPYFTDLTPIVENMAKIHFPNLVKNATVPAPIPVVVATVAATDKA